jgi:hypothetical protein
MLTSMFRLGIFYVLQICDMGPMALLPLRRKARWGFFCPEKSWWFRPGLNLQTWVLKGSTIFLDHRSRLYLHMLDVVYILVQYQASPYTQSKMCFSQQLWWMKIQIFCNILCVNCTQKQTFQRVLLPSSSGFCCFSLRQNTPPDMF